MTALQLPMSRTGMFVSIPSDSKRMNTFGTDIRLASYVSESKHRESVSRTKNLVRHFYGTGSTFPGIVYFYYDVSKKLSGNTYPPVKSPGDLLAKVRKSFSLSVTELAAVLLVERPTIYAWIKEKHQIRGPNKNRLLKLSLFANLWDESCKMPIGKYLHQKFGQDLSVYKILTNPNLNETLLKVAISQASELLLSEPKPRHKMSIRQLIKGTKLEGKTTPLDQSYVDALTGKPFSDD